MFGNTRKIRSTVNDFCFDRKIPLFWCKMISVAIFTSKYFRTQTRIEREREREREKRKCEPRNRLWLRRTQKLTVLNPENLRPRKPIRSHQENPFDQTRKTHSSNPENPFDRTISDPHRADRTTGEIVAPQHRSTQNWSFSSHPKTNWTQSPLSLSLSLSLSQFDRIWWIFFVGICFFVFIYWEMILIFVWKMRKCEKYDKNGFSRTFSRIQPNTRKYFSKCFLECNQTLENIFLSRKWNFRKIFYGNQTQPKCIFS